MSKIVIGETLSLVTDFGKFAAQHVTNGRHEGVILSNRLSEDGNLYIRIQSSCLFSETFRTADCDCADQLHAAMAIVQENAGLVLYTYEEGRGAGLEAKMRAIRVQQQQGLHTGAAFSAIGLEVDLRSYRFHADVIRTLVHGRQLVLLSNNRAKLAALRRWGLNVVGRQALVCRREGTRTYLAEKERVLQHSFDDE